MGLLMGILWDIMMVIMGYDQLIMDISWEYDGHRKTIYVW